MKRLLVIFNLLFLIVLSLQSQTPHKFSEAHLKSTAIAADNEPEVPTNLSDIFAGEIAGKLAMELGSWITIGVSAAGVLLIPPNGITTPIFTGTFLGGVAGVAGSAEATRVGYNYNINSWAPYVKYESTIQNEQTSQRVDFNVDLIKCPDNYNHRFIALDAKILLQAGDEFEEGESNIRRSKYMDLYSFRIEPKDKDIATKSDVFPIADNKVGTYSKTITLDVSGEASVQADDFNVGLSGSYGYSATASVNLTDFAIADKGINGNGVVWAYKMIQAYETPTSSSEYITPTDLVASNIATKWLKSPPELATGHSKLNLVSIYTININETRPVVFEYEGIQQLMHVEVLGRWGLPGAKLNGISVAVPSYNVIKGTITVVPNPSNPKLAKISINRDLNKTFTYQEYMDYINKPIPQPGPPVLSSGCYAINQAIDPNHKNYVTHGGGAGIINYNANRGEVKAWEKFSLVYTGKSKNDKDIDTYGFYSQDGRFMQAKPIDMVHKSTALGDWEKWEVIPIPGQTNKYHIKSVGLNRWLSGNRNLWGNLGTASEPNDWEVWSFEPQTGGCTVPLIKPLTTYPHKQPRDLTMSDETETFAVADNTGDSNLKAKLFQALNERSTSFSNQSNTRIPCNFCNNLKEVTVEGWIKNTSVENDIQAIVSATGPQFVHLQMSNDNNVSNAVYMENGRSMMLPVIPKVSAGWHHVALSIKSGDSRVYLDGQQIGATNTTTFTSIAPTSDFYVGKGWAGQRAFNGEMANFKIWSKALSASELSTSMNQLNNTSDPSMVYHSPTLSAIKIENSSDCLAIPEAATIGLASMTIEAWINNQAGGEDIQAIVSSSTGDFVHLQTSNSPSVQNMVYTDNGEVALPVIPKLTSGWHHVAMVVESGNSRIYVDGVVTGSNNTKTFSNILASQSASIGKGWAGGRVFNGSIADVRIWKNRALTQAQIESYRHTPPPASAQGLVYHSN